MAPPAIANGIAYFVATVFSYTANTLWSFGQKVTRQNAARFVQASAFGVVLSMLISGAADLAGFSDLIGIGLIVVLMPPLMFMVHLRWTYK